MITDLVLYSFLVTTLVILPLLFNNEQYWQCALVHLFVVFVGTLLAFRGSLGGLILGSLALTRISLRFFALLFPLIRFSFIRGRVELDFSRISQLFCIILSHSLKLGWKVVMRNVLS